MVVLGIALKISEAKHSSVAGLSGQGGFLAIGRFKEDIKFLELVQSLKPELIAIGSPLCLPLGLDCLEPSCLCEMKFPERKGRLAEQQLSRVGIGYFASNKSHSSPGFIYRGISLCNELRKLGYNVIEVYPSATRVILFGDSAPPKRVALSFLKENLPPLIQGLMPLVHGLDMGACDALLNAYTAVLNLRGETLSMGDGQEGFIIVPKYGKNPILIAR